MRELQLWSWGFLVFYVGAMLVFGAIGMRRVRGGDDFATARGSYGPLFLALAFCATTASGATFLGLPGLAYSFGVPALMTAILYPLGVYTGVMICAAAVWRAGSTFGARSIPEYLGDRYQSDLLRVAVAVFSLMLLFYLAGQLVAGLVMFERMLGLSAGWALGITAAVLLLYVTLGGAHADILTDGAQGALMVALAIFVLVLFATGFGLDGGLSELVVKVRALEPGAFQVLHPKEPLFDSKWDLFAIFIAHIPLGLLPHIGNKLWALRDGGGRRTFIALCFAFGMLLPAIGLGGLLARGILGDALLGAGSNEAIPALFIEILPAWLAALLGVGILSAVMSTADGLIVSTSQVFANDLYRRTFAPRWHPDASAEEIDVRVLSISRWSTFAVLAASAGLAWALLDMNVALLVWVGVGGMMAALTGPLIIGILWRGVTRPGALAGFFAGAIVFVLVKGAFVPTSLFAGGPLEAAALWLTAQAPSPYASAAIGQIASAAVTIGVSLATRGLPKDHLERVFGTSA